MGSSMTHCARGRDSVNAWGLGWIPGASRKGETQTQGGSIGIGADKEDHVGLSVSARALRSTQCRREQLECLLRSDS